MVEITVKIVGSVSVFLASFVYGHIKIRELKRRMNEISSFISLVRYIGDNIEHFMKPIPDIVAEFEDEYLTSCGFLDSARARGLPGAWKDGEFLLAGEARTLLDNYFSNVGTGYVEDERRLADYTAGRLTQILDMETALSKDKERIYKTVPPMLAGSVVLILI
ncbi:MAG: hypothetical protein IJC62_02180 [Clostridia bacterium]|nr:hypothetical protein [Clostridia bacterium]